MSVRAPRSMFRLAEVLSDVVGRRGARRGPAPRRNRPNRPLRTLLNELSRRGRSVRVHGVDEGDAGSDDGPIDVRCGTFWSSKGGEAGTAVASAAAAARNPTYVALTRARDHLVVVLDPREPHAASCGAVVRYPEYCDVLDDHTRRVVARGATGCAPTSPRVRRRSRRAAGSAPSSTRSCRRGRRCARVTIRTVRDDGDGTSRPALVLESAALAVQMAPIRCERAAGGGGVVRCVQDILSPTRLDSEQVEASIARDC